MRALLISYIIFLPILSWCDDYILNRDGEIVFETVNASFTDKLYNYNKTKSIIVFDTCILRNKRDTIFKNQAFTYFGPSKKIKDANNVFRFCAKNAPVEFGLSVFLRIKEDELIGIISTSYDAHSNYGNILVEEIALTTYKGLLFMTSWHSHPSDIDKSVDPPSGFYLNLKFYRFGNNDATYYLTSKDKYGEILVGDFYVFDVNSNKVFQYNSETCKEYPENTDADFFIHELNQLKPSNERNKKKYKK